MLGAEPVNTTLAAFAALLLAGAVSVASAASSVTVFGVVDAGAGYYKTEARDAVSGARTTLSRRTLQSSGIAASRMGFRVVEELRPGLSAGLWLEAQIGNATGSPGLEKFSRRSTVSVWGKLGEIRLGRDFTPTSWNDILFDPFESTGAGTSVISQVSDAPFLANDQHFVADNSVGYFLPTGLAGFYGQAMYGFRRDVTTGSAFAGTVRNSLGPYVGARLGYENGRLNIAVSRGQSTVIGTPALSYKVTTTNLGASYDFRTFKLFGELSRLAAGFKFPLVDYPSYQDSYSGVLLGASAPIASGVVRVAYSVARYEDGLPFSSGSAPRASKLAFGYVHHLSRRTALYATVVRVTNRNDPLYSGILAGASLTAGGSLGFATGGARGLFPERALGGEFGIRHSF